jgi:hypothetical protein
MPERGGHTAVNVLLRIAAGSRSPSAAQATTSLPPFWRTAPRSSSGTSGSAVPSSSSNSRRAAAAGSSSSPISPLGIDHAPASFFAQYGPPGWTSSTSSPAASSR